MDKLRILIPVELDQIVEIAIQNKNKLVRYTSLLDVISENDNVLSGMLVTENELNKNDVMEYIKNNEHKESTHRESD